MVGAMGIRHAFVGDLDSYRGSSTSNTRERVGHAREERKRTSEKNVVGRLGLQEATYSDTRGQGRPRLVA